MCVSYSLLLLVYVLQNVTAFFYSLPYPSLVALMVKMNDDFLVFNSKYPNQIRLCLCFFNIHTQKKSHFK